MLAATLLELAFLVTSAGLIEAASQLGPEGKAKILVAGAPRTGTQSVAEALNILGYDTAHLGANWSLRVPFNNYLKNEKHEGGYQRSWRPSKLSTPSPTSLHSCFSSSS